jgi:hypothetical protein
LWSNRQGSPYFPSEFQISSHRSLYSCLLRAPSTTIPDKKQTKTTAVRARQRTKTSNRRDVDLCAGSSGTSLRNITRRQLLFTLLPSISKRELDQFDMSAQFLW